MEKEVAAVTAIPFTASPSPMLTMHTPAAWRRMATRKASLVSFNASP